MVSDETLASVCALFCCLLSFLLGYGLGCKAERRAFCLYYMEGIKSDLPSRVVRGWMTDKERYEMDREVEVPR